MTSIAQGIARVALLTWVVLFASPRSARSDGCGDDEMPPPAAGHYKGSFDATFGLVIPPALKANVTWDGELSFDLGRTELDDSRPIPPPPPSPLPRRKPLRPRAKSGDGAPTPPLGTAAPDAPWPSDRARPGQFASDEEQIAARLKEIETSEERNREQAEKVLRWYAEHLPPGHMYVPKHQKPQIKGTTTAKSSMKMEGAFGAGINGSGEGRNTEPATWDVEAEERDPAEGFKHVKILGDPSSLPFVGSARVTGPEGHGEGRLSSGAPRGGPPPGAPGSEAGFGNPDARGRLLVAQLDVLSTDCSTIRGVVDVTAFRARIQSKVPNAQVTPKESEWSAKLDEKDEAYERQVDALVDEPIPAELDWPYLDSFSSRWAALKPSPPTDYKLCVYKRLEKKFVRINRAAVQLLVKNFPTAEEGATCAVIHAAVAKLLPFLRVLQLYGGDCPEIGQAVAKMETEMAKVAAAILARKHDETDLECLYSALMGGMLGEQTEAVETAIQEALTARLNREPTSWYPGDPHGR